MSRKEFLTALKKRGVDFNFRQFAIEDGKPKKHPLITQPDPNGNAHTVPETLHVQK